MINPTTGDTVMVQNLLSQNGIKWLLTNLLSNFQTFTPLGLVLAIATAPRATAEFFNLVLALVSAPMYCGNIWALSILLWACLFLASAEVGHHCK